MGMHFKDIVHECTTGSDNGTLNFPQVVAMLMAAGVERYHADLSRSERTYYLPDGTSEVVPGHMVATSAGETFAAEDIVAALRAIQAKDIGYAEFCERIAAAGCVGYVVSLVGRRVVYSGRSGDFYVEKFPGAK